MLKSNEGKGNISPIHYETLSMSSLIAKGEISARQKQIANNYTVIKKIFGFTAVHSRITSKEESVLRIYNMNLLEHSTISEINQELDLLKKWSNSYDENLRKHADEIFEIRVKELKYLHACNYLGSYCEIYDGHRALEKYIEFIAE